MGNREVASHANTGHLFLYVTCNTRKPCSYRLERTICKIGNYTEGALELRWPKKKGADGQYRDQDFNVTVRCRVPNVALYHKCCSKYPTKPNNLPTYQPEKVEVQLSLDGGRRWLQSSPPSRLQLMWDYVALLQTQELPDANDAA